jgi:hypothetical protein
MLLLKAQPESERAKIQGLAVAAPQHLPAHTDKKCHVLETGSSIYCGLQATT